MWHALIREEAGENRKKDCMNRERAAHNKWFLEDGSGSDYLV